MLFVVGIIGGTILLATAGAWLYWSKSRLLSVSVLGTVVFWWVWVFWPVFAGPSNIGTPEGAAAQARFILGGYIILAVIAVFVTTAIVAAVLYRMGGKGSSP